MERTRLPLEDGFNDIVRKAMRGTGVDERRLAGATGVDAAVVTRWLRGDAVPSDEQARAAADVLALDPATFADSAARRWYPPEITIENVRRHAQHPHPSNGYVFFLDDRRAALVDPAGDPAHLLKTLRDGAYRVQYVLVTHRHADHCDAVDDVAAAFPDAQIVMHELDAHAIGSLAAKSLHVRDGATLPFGDSAEIRVLHTPGHTDGSISFLYESMLFTGDTLFAGSVGGAYGNATTYGDILDSIRTRLFSLPGETAVMPGHGPASTIAEEKRHNPFFSAE